MLHFLSPLRLCAPVIGRWAFCAALGVAASAPAAPKDPPKSLRFYYAGFSQSVEHPDPDAGFLIADGPKTVPVLLHPNAFSSTLTYAGPLPVPLCRERQTETGVKREDLGQLSFPSEWGGALFLVTRDPANPRLPFQFYPVEYWAPSVPDHHVRIINLCPSALAARIGAGQASVNAHTTLDLPLADGPPDVPLRLAIHRTDHWERLLSTAIVRPAQGKFLLIIFPRPDGAPRVLIVKDLPQPPPS